MNVKHINDWSGSEAHLLKGGESVTEEATEWIAEYIFLFSKLEKLDE